MRSAWTPNSVSSSRVMVWDGRPRRSGAEAGLRYVRQPQTQCHGKQLSEMERDMSPGGVT